MPNGNCTMLSSSLPILVMQSFTLSNLKFNCSLYVEYCNLHPPHLLCILHFASHLSSDGSITSYGWDFNGDNFIDNNQSSPQYIYTQVGNYGVKLEVQTQFGCVNTIIKSVYVNATPSALFTAQNKVGCPMLCVNFTNNSTIGTGNIVTNQWIFGDNSSPDYSQNPTHNKFVQIRVCRHKFRTADK